MGYAAKRVDAEEARGWGERLTADGPAPVGEASTVGARVASTPGVRVASTVGVRVASPAGALEAGATRAGGVAHVVGAAHADASPIVREAALVREAAAAYSLREDGPLPDAQLERIEALAEKIGRYAAHLHAGEHRLLELIREFDRLEGWKLFGQRNLVDWLAFWAGFDRRTAREKVRVARSLASLPRVSEAMRSGRLSFSKVRAVTRLGGLEPEDEETMVELAEQTTAAELEKVVRRRRMVSRREEEARERRRHRSRTLAVYPEGGMYEIRGRLDPEVGALLMRALEAAGDALYAGEREEPLGPEPPEPGQRRADAIGLLAQRALAAGFGVAPAASPADGPAEPGETEAREGEAAATGSAATGSEAEAAGGSAEPDVDSSEFDRGAASPPRLHDGGRDAPGDAPPDASSGSAEPAGSSSLCTCGGHPAPILGTQPEHYQVILHLDAAALALAGESECSHLEDGTRISASTARRLACSASIVPLLEKADGSTLDLGRSTRQPSPAQRRALRIRDGGCRFPGCGLRFTEPHHVVHWALGGETNLSNLILLCQVHHRAVHDDGFRVEAMEDQEFRFFSPEGYPLGDRPPCVKLEPGDPAVELIRRNRRRGVRPRRHEASARYEHQAHIPPSLLFRAWEVADGA